MTQTKALNLEGITHILKEYKEELKKKYGIKEIGIFGSYVKKIGEVSSLSNRRASLPLIAEDSGGCRTQFADRGLPWGSQMEIDSHVTLKY